MPDVTFTHTTEQWTKLQLAIYVHRPGLFWDDEEDEGLVVIERTSDGTPMVVGDGSGQNVLEATDAQLQAVINNGRPPDDTVIMSQTRRWWKGKINTAKEKRDAYLASQESDPFDDGWEE